MTKDTRGHPERCSPSTATVPNRLLKRFCELCSSRGHPINLTLRVIPFSRSVGSILLSFHQSSLSSDVEVWTAIESDHIALDGGRYYVFCQPEHRALIRTTNCRNEEHFRRWFLTAAERVYKRRVKELEKVYAELLFEERVPAAILGWSRETFEGLFGL